MTQQQNIGIATDGPAPDLAGRVVWVTGASRGLGRAVALALATAGADLVLTARSTDHLGEVARGVRAIGRQALLAPGSVDDPDLPAATVEAALERFGRLDVLVNNAGISPTLDRSEDLDPERWQQVIDVNLTGAFRCTQAAVRPMLEAGTGSIVNVSSVHGSAGAARLAAYCASKGGMELLTRSLAAEWADRGVRVNAVAPGYLETDMTEGLRGSERSSARLLAKVPNGRFGQVGEVAPAIVFLASDQAAYITGASLAVDGGWTAV